MLRTFLGLALLLAAAPTMGQTVNFTIDPTQGIQPISPYIYGVNSGTNVALNLTAVRSGGNRWTAYNWTNNDSNAGSDYFYQNDGYLSSSTTPGAAVQGFLQAAANANQAAVITIPTNGYVAADRSGPVDKTIPPGQSPHFVPEFPAASADPNPAANHVYQDQFINWVKANFPNGFASGSKQPIFISLDNEPDLWSSTHPEVHPSLATYAELVQRSTAYATSIKSVSQNALVYGPVNYGWEGYLTLQNASDSSANNNAINPNTGKPYGDFVSYYLAQMKTAGQTAGKRLLDVEDVHWYPEATGLNAGGTPTRITGTDTSPGVVAARVQAPRSLWDPNYVETSWITQYTTGGKAIQLVPRLQSEINANYAGTKLSISEYNYGGPTDISGGIAQADVLGVYGKQGLFSANEWPLASHEPFILGAMEMYRNYDGKGSTFGDTSVSATNSNSQNTSIYASTSSTTPGRMVLVALNKTANPINAAITLNNSSSHYTSFAVYQLTSGSTLISGGTVASPTYVNTYPIADLSNFTMPGHSVSTLVPMVAAPAGTIYDWNTLASSSTANTTDWTAGSNWNPNGSPGFGLADIARFGNTATIGAGNTVYLNGNQTIAQLVNQNATAWTLASGTPTNSALTLNEITQSSSAALTISTALVADSTSQLNFDGAGTGKVTVSGVVSGNLSNGGLIKLIKSGGGMLEIKGGLSLGNDSSLAVNSGSLKINISSGSASVGSGVTAMVNSGATLELAGSVSALSSGVNRVKITNNNAATGVLVSGTNQQVGNIDGAGNTQVNAGSDLTANQIIQSALIIGGTASSHGLVTIDPSDPSGNPLAQPASQSSGLISASSVAASAPFGAGTEVADGLSAGGGSVASDTSGSATIGANLGESASTVPEPATILLLALGGLACLAMALRRRVRAR